MATRFYYEYNTTPDISPAFDAVWDETASAIRRDMTLDTPSGGDQEIPSDYLTVDSATGAYYLLAQLISPSLGSISATFSAVKAVVRTYESNAKCNAYSHFVFRKCDADGSNLTTIDSATDDVEWNGLVSRYLGSTNLSDSSFTDGQRLIIEFGFFADTTKDYPDYYGETRLHDNYGSDFPEEDDNTSLYNTWFETGDTFSEYSGGGTLTISVDDDMTSEEYINMNLYSSVLTVNVNDSLGQSEALD